MGKKTNNHAGTGRSFDYFFVKPLLGGDAHASARKLAQIRGVREVSLTEGEYGFIVKTDISDDEGSNTVYDSIRSVVGGKLRRAVCHCSYSGSVR
jgi:hypothetical protein